MVILLALPVAHAAAVSYRGQPRLYQEVQPSVHGATFSFEASVAVEAAADAYLKVVPAPNNPAFANGTPAAGWWTTVLLHGEGPPTGGGSNGTGIVELGRLEPNRTYRLAIEVRVPEGALDTPVQHQLRYALALRAGSGSGSGGQLDPSLSVNPRIVVSETARSVVPEPPAARDIDPWPVESSLAVAAAVLILVLIGRRQRDAR